MLRRSLQMSLLALLLLIAPVSAMAQQVGTLVLENRTGATIRIGCDHYINSDGQQVNLDAYWTLPPNFNGRLAMNGADIRAQKFVFFIITPDGESAGWTIGKVARGSLGTLIDSRTLATHKQQAASRLPTSAYPRLTTKEVNIANVNAAIQNGEGRLSQLNVAIPIAQTGLAFAKSEYQKLLNDPNATNGEKLIAAAAITATEIALNQLVAERDTLQYNLNANRSRLHQLQAQPD